MFSIAGEEPDAMGQGDAGDHAVRHPDRLPGEIDKDVSIGSNHRQLFRSSPTACRRFSASSELSELAKAKTSSRRRRRSASPFKNSSWPGQEAGKALVTATGGESQEACDAPASFRRSFACF